MQKYNTDKLLKNAINLIEKHKLFFVVDVFTMLGIAKATFYEHFPNGSDGYNKIWDALREQRTQVKINMRSKWHKSNHPTLQIALYKLICTPEEHRLISQSHIDHTTDGEKIPVLDFSGLSQATKDELFERITKRDSGKDSD